MNDKPPDLLIWLLGIVPQLPQLIRNGDMRPGIYDVMLGIIAKHGSDDQREWSDLAQVIRQDRALLVAGY